MISKQTAFLAVDDFEPCCVATPGAARITKKYQPDLSATFVEEWRVMCASARRMPGFIHTMKYGFRIHLWAQFVQYWEGAPLCFCGNN